MTPAEEAGFKTWVIKNHVPFDPGSRSDYDMRGYYKDLVLKGKSDTANKKDGMHFVDTYKTPYHHSFSNESKYMQDRYRSNPNAPHWIDGDLLVGAKGKVYFNEPLFIKQQEAKPKE